MTRSPCGTLDITPMTTRLIPAPGESGSRLLVKFMPGSGLVEEPASGE